MENGYAFVLQALPREVSPERVRIRSSPGSESRGCGAWRGRGEVRGALGTLTEPLGFGVQFPGMFANEQKFCPAQKSIMPKCVCGCFKERKQRHPQAREQPRRPAEQNRGQAPETPGPAPPARGPARSSARSSARLAKQAPPRALIGVVGGGRGSAPGVLLGRRKRRQGRSPGGGGAVGRWP